MILAANACIADSNISNYSWLVISHLFLARMFWRIWIYCFQMHFIVQIVYRIHWIMFIWGTSTWVPFPFVLSSLWFVMITLYAHATMYVWFLVLSIFEELSMHIRCLYANFSLSSLNQPCAAHPHYILWSLIGYLFTHIHGCALQCFDLYSYTCMWMGFI